ITTIVVTERYHTRFYPINPADMEGKDKNCKPGTLVHTTVTSPYFKEFFLQSHAGLVGTAKPAHYFVVQNDVNRKLLYTYVRATCGISYAPPAYYADSLCECGCIYLQDLLTGIGNIHQDLNKKKEEWEEHRKNIRDAIFKPAKEQQKSATGKWPRKTKEEEVMELVHKNEVLKLCQREALAQAEVVWKKHIVNKPGEKRKNPWKPALDKSMFWM
ncbi:Piwi-domain-containing protein, partial [Setomelanomma holmii]